MLWRVVTFEQDLGLAVAMTHLELAKEMGLHLIEPRLALMVCQQLRDTIDLDEAATVGGAVLTDRTTDTAFDDLALWLIWTKHSAAAAARAAEKWVRMNPGRTPTDTANKRPPRPSRFQLTGPE